MSERDIVERLKELVIARAFGDRRISDGILAERLIRDRQDAATEIERLRARVSELETGWSRGEGGWG